MNEVNWLFCFITPSEAGPVSVFRQRSTQPSRPSRQGYSIITHHRNTQFVIRDEKRSCLRAVTGKWIMKNKN
jgi:hypothetical protein